MKKGHKEGLHPKNGFKHVYLRNRKIAVPFCEKSAVPFLVHRKWYSLCKRYRKQNDGGTKDAVLQSDGNGDQSEMGGRK